MASHHTTQPKHKVKHKGPSSRARARSIPRPDVELGAPPQFVGQPFVAGQVYHFLGYDFTNNVQRDFYTLAGETAAKIVGGFAKIQVIDRPRRKGFTMPVGYDPISVDVPIHIDEVVSGGSEPPGIHSGVENDILTLEWMGGRGILYGGPNQSHNKQAIGNPPIVSWSTTNSNVNSPHETNLVPANVHGYSWVISNIAYGDPIRDQYGNRRRQPVVLTLTEWVPIPTGKKPTVPTNKFRTFQSTQALNTVAKVARPHLPSHNQTMNVYAAIVEYNQDVFQKAHKRYPVSRPTQAFPKVGTKVEIPDTYLAPPT